ncbi:MAG: hypothetical protein GTN97_09245 [Nitrosopumilaceae archaeon]|nr:hypothetical protein [Nitrosopumilaceae archaeon]NIP09804.1 hypothetical protein [Nitrosopumilaceae archaeon]NIS96061.1 hypothetical protein [Nitrosopumilaceae archaeon]
MTLLKNKKTTLLILIGIGVVSVLSSLFIFENSCGLKHIAILNDLKTYESTLDPEFCEELIERIDSFNMQCKPEVEILDCG